MTEPKRKARRSRRRSAGTGRSSTVLAGFAGSERSPYAYAYQAALRARRLTEEREVIAGLETALRRAYAFYERWGVPRKARKKGNRR
jgi:hypothetical protein